MKEICKDEVLQYKKSDTLVIWGSGSSIKSLTEDDFTYLNKFDSLGFNSACELNVKFTYFIVGEILFNYYRLNSQQKNLYKNNSPPEYIDKLTNIPDSCFLLWNDKKTLHPNHLNYLNKLNNNYYKFNQYGHGSKIKLSGLKIDGEFVDKNLYNVKTLLDNKTLLHQYKGINTPIYFAKCMDYKQIIFVGVDLSFGRDNYAITSRKTFFDSWISTVHNRNLKVHPCKEYLFKFIKYLKNDIKFTTYTKSLLEEIIEIHKVER